jgi:hypothetical protein
MTDIPQATLTASGFCHNLPLEGHSRAGAVVLRLGIPAVPVFLGTIAGRDVTLDVMSLAELDELEATLLRARVVLMMWQQDHAAPAAADAQVAMLDAGFPVMSAGQIAAEVAEDVHRLIAGAA